ncbi:MAG TPA: tetratricopeptide repeat protein [Candidatus Obscuribacterales bacterium]
MTSYDPTHHAENGDATSHYQLALMYHKGNGVPKDLKQAIRWYRKAAEEGLAKAQVQLASMYFRGEGVPAALDKAAFWYERAAEQGDIESCRQIAVMYAEGKGVTASFAKALEWYAHAQDAKAAFETLLELFRRTADQSDAGLKLELANILLNNSNADKMEATEWLRKAAADESCDACLQLAHLLKAAGDQESTRESLSWLRKAEVLGSKEAGWSLVAIEFEQSSNPDLFDRLSEAAEAGHVHSQFHAARALLEGIPGYKDESRAKGWLELAAAAGSAPAAYTLFRIMHAHNGSSDPTPALKYLEQAAAGGVSDAMAELARVLGTTSGAGSDWLRKAAELGHPWAQFTLSQKLQTEGAPDWVQWLHRSADGGLAEAQVALAAHYLENDAHHPDIEKLLRLASDAGNAEAAFRLSQSKYGNLHQKQQWLELAANRQHREALWALGKQLFDRAEQDSKERGFGYLLEAAAQGHPHASSEVGFELLKLTGWDAAQIHLEAAAQAGIADACYAIAQHLLNEEFSAEKAIPYLETAVNAGHIAASYELAVLLARGEGAEADFETAAELFLIAAKAGDSEAQYRYAMMSMAGLGTEQDIENARDFLITAHAQGHAGAGLALADLKVDTGDDADLTDALRIYDELADNGSALACARLGELFLGGIFTIDNDALCKRLALYAQLSPEAKYVLKIFYEAPVENFPTPEAAVVWYKQGESDGDADAIFRLAECKSLGLGTPADNLAAMALYARAAGMGHSGAQLALADCYYFGEGLPQDVAQAATFYKKAADNGNAKAQFSLATMYDAGEGVEKDQEAALDYYRLAAENDHGFAQLSLAQHFERRQTEKALTEAITWYERAAERGIAEAQFKLAWMYIEGVTQAPTADLPRSLLTRAAEQQHGDASLALAKVLLAEGTDEAIDQAVSYLRVAASFDNAEAHYQLGTLLLNGNSRNSSNLDAAEHFSIAAKQHHPGAQFSLGLMHLNGVGVDENTDLAATLFERAAAQGLADAQYVLGLMYAEGTGKNRDPEQAVLWFRKAADNKNVDACFMLAKAYAEGIGLHRDKKSAIAWCQRAAQCGHMEAERLLKELATAVN